MGMIFRKVIVVFCFFICCGFSSAKASEINHFDYIFNNGMLNDVNYTIATQKGTFENVITMKHFPYAFYKVFDTCEEAIKAVHLGEADATIVSSSLERTIEKRYPDLKMTYIVQFLPDTGFGVSKKRKDILEKLNSFIAYGQQNGIFEDMYHRWIHNSFEKMPTIPEVKDPTETIIFAAEKEYAPMSYIDKNGKESGFLIEFVKRFALYANIKAEIKMMQFDEIPDQMRADKVQVWVSTLMKSAERLKYMDYTNPFLEENLSLIIKKDRYIKDKNLKVFYNLPVGTLPGDAPILESEVPLSKEVLYTSNDQLLAALEKKEIVGANFAFPVALPIIKNHPEYLIYPATLGENIYSIAVSPSHQELRDKMNDLQERYIQNGVYREIHHIWFGIDSNLKKLPPKPKGEKKLVVGFIPNAAPFSYIDENKNPVGLAIHILYRQLQDLGYGIEKFVPYDYETIFKAIEKREIDIAVGDLTVTRGRSKIARLMKPYFKTFNVIIVHRDFMNNVLQNGKKEKIWKRIFSF